MSWIRYAGPRIKKEAPRCLTGYDACFRIKNTNSRKKEPLQRCSEWVHRGRGEVNSLRPVPLLASRNLQ